MKQSSKLNSLPFVTPKEGEWYIAFIMVVIICNRFQLSEFQLEFSSQLYTELLCYKVPATKLNADLQYTRVYRVCLLQGRCFHFLPKAVVVKYRFMPGSTRQIQYFQHYSYKWKKNS